MGSQQTYAAEQARNSIAAYLHETDRLRAGSGHDVCQQVALVLPVQERLKTTRQSLLLRPTSDCDCDRPNNLSMSTLVLFVRRGEPLKPQQKDAEERVLCAWRAMLLTSGGKLKPSSAARCTPSGQLSRFGAPMTAHIFMISSTSLQADRMNSLRPQNAAL